MSPENTSPFEFEYDMALSFAEEDRAVAEELTHLLASRGINVFHDEYRAADAERWGKDMLDHLVNIYARKSRYCVMLISHYYPLKAWTEEERISVRERAMRDADEYILPVQLDDSKVPGLVETPGYQDLRQHSMQSIVNLLEQKLTQRNARSGPPSKSHDLRSGNIPPKDSLR